MGSVFGPLLVLGQPFCYQFIHMLIALSRENPQFLPDPLRDADRGKVVLCRHNRRSPPYEHYR